MPPQLERLLYTLRTYAWLWDPRRFTSLPELKIDRPIFLVGTQGGGLTLLSRMLRRHPRAISASGDHRYWTSSDEIQNTMGLILPESLSGIRFKAPPHPRFTPPRSWCYAARDLFPRYRRRAENADLDQAARFKHCIRLAAVRHAPDRQNFRFVDKSQSFIVRAGLVWRLLEDCQPQFVLVPRDPYVSVQRAAEGKAGDMRRYASFLSLEERIDICAEHYANSFRSFFEDAESEGFPYHLVLFERLLEAPEATLRALCTYCGLDFREDMLPQASHRLPIGSRYRDRWFPLRADVNQAYLDRLHPHTVARVNHHCGDMIERLGYHVLR